MTRVARITVGSGSPEGANSAYLLPDRRIVVDPGPPSDAAWDALSAGIRDSGLSLDDVDHIVVTHWHADHTGLAPRLAAAADATIHMHARDAGFVGSYDRTRTERLERDAATLRRWGVPASTVERVIDGDTPSPLPTETEVVSHEDGDEVAGGRLLHTPGHTAGHAVLDVDGHLFVGDTILPTYTPNVGGSDTRLENPLDHYLTSLARLERRIGACTFHPGHGEALSLPDRLDHIRAHHEERTRRVLDRVTERTRATPWEVACDLFGDLAGMHVKFGAGEAAAHLEYLRARGDLVDGGTETAVYEHRRPSDTDRESGD